MLYFVPDSRHHTKPESSRGFVMPEVNVVIITNVMMRGTYLDDYIPERAKFLGFWEHISSLGYKTIGARMTSLSQEQVNTLLEKLKLSAMNHRIMVRVRRSLCIHNLYFHFELTLYTELFNLHSMITV